MKTSALIPLGCFLTLSTAAASGPAQKGEDVPGSDQEAFRVTTRLVVVNVVVHDKKGAPVAGLTRGAFTLLDGGKEEKISLFSVERRGAAHGSATPLSYHVFSNRVAREGEVPISVTAILLDGSETKFEDFAYARQQLIKFFTQLQPQDRVALYVFGRQLRVIQDFTSAPSPLIEALQQSGNPAAGATDTSAQLESAAQARSGASTLAALRFNTAIADLVTSRIQDYRRLGLLEALQAIAKHLSGLPGRKSIIWLTGAVPLPQSLPGSISKGGSNPLLEENVQQTIRAMNQADVALFPVDARGLFVDPAFKVENGAREAYERGAYGTGLNAMTLVTQAMIYWGDETGGKAFYNTNDLPNAIRSALDDSQVTYTLGYYPTHGQWDGRYRAIKVRVNMRGVEVRHRQGYFASTAGAESVKKKDRMALLKEVALNPLEATGVGVTVRVRPFKGTNGGYKIEINVSPDLNDLTFQPVNGRWTGLLDVLAGQYSKQGRSLRGTTKTLSENMTNATYQEVMRKGMMIGFYQDVSRTAEEVRVVVRDGLSGATGSVKIPLHQ